MNKTLAWILGIIGVLLIILAVVYWVVPAGSLPTFLPGYEAGVAATHFKHGLVALIVGALVLLFVWFMTAPKKSQRS